MKKHTSMFLTICIVFCLTFTLFGCTEKCSHSWNLKSDTTTCEKDGIKTYKCTICGEIKTESSLAKGHDWKQTSSTASCTSNGIVTYKCNNCNKTKQESEKATGHLYYSWGICKTCGQFKYNISPSISLPKTLGYCYQYGSGRISYYSKCQITKIHFETQDDYLVVFFYGTKTYDEDGAYGSARVEFTCVLKDSNGNIIASKNISISGLVENQKFGSNGYYGVKFCKISSLSLNNNYILEVVDRKI